MLLAFSVFRPCISVHHIGNAYRQCISAMHIVASTTRTTTRTNERTNGNELTQPFAAPEMTAGLTITPEMTAHAPAHQIDPLTMGEASPGILTHYQNHPAIDQISPVSISPHCQFTTGPPRPDLVPNRPEARPNQDRQF